MLPGEKKYPHIFSPGKLGRLEIKNRIKYASTEAEFNNPDGWVAHVTRMLRCRVGYASRRRVGADHDLGGERPFSRRRLLSRCFGAIYTCRCRLQVERERAVSRATASVAHLKRAIHSGILDLDAA